MNPNFIWIWMLMLVAKNTQHDPRYTDAVNHAYDQSYSQSGVQQQVQQAQSYAEGRGHQVIQNLGINEGVVGAPVYLYRVYQTRSVSPPAIHLPTGCTLEAHGAQTGGSVNLTWHF